MDVYMRQDMWVKGRKLTKKEKKNKHLPKLLMLFDFLIVNFITSEVS